MVKTGKIKAWGIRMKGKLCRALAMAGGRRAVGMFLAAAVFFALCSGCGQRGLEITYDLNKELAKGEEGLKSPGGSVPLYTGEGVSYGFRTEGKYFQQFQKNGSWKEILPVGVNIGAGKPGAFPGEFAITKEDYLRWFGLIRNMHANVIRVYTILMPEFYEALSEYNKTAETPLYFMQGVYNNEEDIATIKDAYGEHDKIARDWISMCRTIVDVVHGNADIPLEPGNAGGIYKADVSSYLLGWILGIEWDPEFVIKTNEKNGAYTEFEGDYLYTEQASPFEVFLASGLDACISHEMQQYGMQHPTAFANWVTTDPLSHPGEPNPEVEDAVPVDAEHIKAKPGFQAGLFASYHVYPYYPEMMRYAPELLTDSPPNPYRQYLDSLTAYHTIPVMVSEFGVPTSRGITHLAKRDGFSQGGLTEEEQGEALVSMLDDILQAGCAGACVFIWQDEWFKRTWNTMDFTDAENGPYWCDVQTSEQFFGLLAFDPGEEAACIIDGEDQDWEGEKPILDNGRTQLYVKSDEAYVYLLLRGENDRLRISIDTIEGQGNVAWDGADFSLKLDGEKESRLSVHPYYDVNYWLYTKGVHASSQVLEEQDGYADAGSRTFAPIYFMLNRPITLTDGTKIGAEQTETGKLRHGVGNPELPGYDSLADFCINGTITEIRLPWLLLNIPKPNVKMRIADLYGHDGITYEPVEEIKFSIDGVSGSYSWEGWEKPGYRERLKQSYYILQDYLTGRAS